MKSSFWLASTNELASSHRVKKVFVYEADVCDRRSLDANKLCTYFSQNNYELVEKPKDADIIILITCAATHEMAEYALDKVKRFQKYSAELVVGGCLPVIEKKKLAHIFYGRVIAANDFDKVDNLFLASTTRYNNIEDANTLHCNKDQSAIKNIIRNLQWVDNVYVEIEDYILKKRFGDRSFLYTWHSPKNPLYIVRTSWGCLGHCTYCAIKKAIGNFLSKPLDQCIKELQKGLSRGYRKIVVTGDDTGAYGLDIGCSFPELLNEFTRIPGQYEILVQSLNPQWVIKYMDEIEKILRRDKIISLEVPIQSGSARILRLMHRFSDIQRMKDTFLRLRTSFPKLSLLTDYILGFPTETNEECEQTLNLINEIGFNGSIIKFSCKTDTDAMDIEPKVPENEVRKRLEYAKKFLKNARYNVYMSKIHLLFEKGVVQ